MINFAINNPIKYNMLTINEIKEYLNILLTGKRNSIISDNRVKLYACGSIPKPNDLVECLYEENPDPHSFGIYIGYNYEVISINRTITELPLLLLAGINKYTPYAFKFKLLKRNYND